MTNLDVTCRECLDPKCEVGKRLRELRELLACDLGKFTDRASQDDKSARCMLHDAQARCRSKQRVQL